MTLSTMLISSKMFRSPSALIIPCVLGIVMNYLVLSGTILMIASLLISDEALWTGFVVLASVPAAVAVIPFADFLKGNAFYALVGAMGAYLSGIVIMPLIIFGFLGKSFAVEPDKLVITIVMLIVLPLMASRLLMWAGIDKRIAPFRGTITNWSFFLVVYAIVGLNRELFIERPLSLLPVAIIAIASTFVLGFIIEGFARLFRIDQGISTSLVLLGTLKNYGIAGGMALTLIGEESAVPATVSTVFMIVYIIWLGFRARMRDKSK
jgi:BASS family bile acid:Na+ symporter